MEQNIKIKAGDFVKVTGKYGTEYGMCDGLYNGNVGFVTADVRSWETRFARPDEDVEVCEEKKDKEAAQNAARCYFSLELASIERRIALDLEDDDRKKLQEMKDYCEYWLNNLKG